MGDFGQLDPVESEIYDVENSEVFANLADCQVLEMLINYRAMNDPEYKLFLEDQDKVRDDKQFNMKTYGKKECRKSLAWTNRTRRALNEKWNLKESQNVKYITLKNIRVYKNLPIISKKTTSVGDKKYGYKIRNNEEFEVIDFDNTNIQMKSIITEEIIKIKHEEFKFFELAYCITVHCSQGDTIREPYSIYEWQRFNKKLMYVAMSRATMKSHVNFCNIDYDLYHGYVYKITNTLTDKIYIGSTKTSIEQRFEEHVKCNDGSPLHSAMQELGAENFKIELVEKVEYYDEEQLLITEACHMMKNNSIEAGYNTKFSVSLENLY